MGAGGGFWGTCVCVMGRVFLEDEDRQLSAAAALSRPKNGKQAVATARVRV